MFYSNILKQVDSDLAEQTFPSKRPQNSRRSFGGGFGGNRSSRNYSENNPRNRENNFGNRDRNNGNRFEENTNRRFDERKRTENPSFERPTRSFDKPKRSFNDRPSKTESNHENGIRGKVKSFFRKNKDK